MKILITTIIIMIIEVTHSKTVIIKLTITDSYNDNNDINTGN